MNNVQTLSPDSLDAHSNSNGSFERWIERVLAVMASTYGARFADMWHGIEPAELKREWLRKLSNYTPAEIVRGIDSLGRFPPTLPEFQELCRPKPGYETAYHEAVEQTRLRATGKDTWSNPAIFWASLRISKFDLERNSYLQNKARWIAALDYCMEKPQQPIPAAQIALPPAGAAHDPAVAKANLEKIHSMLKIKGIPNAD